ncbi:MAG: hypothetical protein PF505_13940 [Vallitaleaceae bacterium]|jgi:ABC-2 type transport system permease protein|nr:hypothetical protein [Vallitaleaceae bacterium]
MKVFVGIIKVRILLLLQYRMAAIAGIFTQIFFGGLFIMVFDAFFASGNQSSMPMTFSQTVTYIWLGQAFLGLLPWNGDREVQAMIREGQVAYEFLRPLNLYAYWYARIFSQRIAGTLLRCFPLIIVASLIAKPYGLSTPFSVTNFILFIVALIAAVLLGCAISNLITISVLFTIGDGMDRLFPAIVMFFSGMVIPLPLFPDWAQGILKVLPFSGLTDTPYRYYLGMYGTEDFLLTTTHAILWTIALVILGEYMIHVSKKHIVVMGG